MKEQSDLTIPNPSRDRGRCSFSSHDSVKGDDKQSRSADGASLLDHAAAERRILRKLDLRFMPIIVLIYIMKDIDKTSISAARLKGLESDLRLTDIQYDTAVAILFVSCCTAQVPSTMIMNRIPRPSLYTGLCVMAWGLFSAMTGLTRNYNGILACRFLIGFPESVFYPGMVYLLSRWYTRKELALRGAILYSGSIISNAFGSLMAAGILSTMEGKRGIRGWRWLFFIEGAITILVGILSLWSLPDYPHNTRWISKAEQQLAQARLAEDAGEADEDLAHDSMWQGLKMSLKDIKVYIFAVIQLCTNIGQSYTNFFPTLTSTLGFSTTISLLLTTPPWIWAAINAWITAWHADRTGERFFHFSYTLWGVIIGYIIALSTSSIGGRYFSMFLMTSGHTALALTLVWVANTIARPPAKRAAALGLVDAVGNLGNLIGSYAWRAKWGPAYHQSMAIGIATCGVSSFLAYVMRSILKNMNKKLDEDELGALKEANRERVVDAARLEGITLEEAMEKKKRFRYLY